jgi:septal ring factor EnvC (AmiA/AmiB activator)
VQSSKFRLVRYSRAVSEARRAALTAARTEQLRDLERAQANVRDLKRMLTSLDGLDQVDDWLAQRLAKLSAEAETRRSRHRAEAGRAAASMRERGEDFMRIAEMSGTTVKTVRELIRFAAAARPDEKSDAPRQTNTADGSPTEWPSEPPTLF